MYLLGPTLHKVRGYGYFIPQCSLVNDLFVTVATKVSRRAPELKLAQLLGDFFYLNSLIIALILSFFSPFLGLKTKIQY